MPNPDLCQTCVKLLSEMWCEGSYCAHGRWIGNVVECDLYVPNPSHSLGKVHEVKEEDIVETKPEQTGEIISLLIDDLPGPFDEIRYENNLFTLEGPWGEFSFLTEMAEEFVEADFSIIQNKVKEVLKLLGVTRKC